MGKLMSRLELRTTPNLNPPSPLPLPPPGNIPHRKIPQQRHLSRTEIYYDIYHDAMKR